jgi:hypothetical protein
MITNLDVIFRCKIQQTFLIYIGVRKAVRKGIYIEGLAQIEDVTRLPFLGCDRSEFWKEVHALTNQLYRDDASLLLPMYTMF